MKHILGTSTLTPDVLHLQTFKNVWKVLRGHPHTPLKILIFAFPSFSVFTRCLQYYFVL